MPEAVAETVWKTDRPGDCSKQRKSEKMPYDLLKIV